MNAFSKAKGNLGFGCMRLPMKDGEVDTAHFSEMIDFFLDNGFNYFDTAHGYLDGKSEIALRECLTSRHEREAYVLTNKLTGTFFDCREDIRPFFESQLEVCGVDYFDFYLMHAQNKQLYKKFKECSAYETAFELKAEGKIRHVGISFHDSPELLDTILTEYPAIETVQIQFNYYDYDDPWVRSKECYDVCRRHNKPVMIMEPVKGGTLVKLPENAVRVMEAMGSASPAEYAIRYCAGFEGVAMVLSGMGNMDMIKENVGFMKDFVPLSEAEHSSLTKIREIIRSQNMIACTGCRYCVSGCPSNILIPDLFGCLNDKNIFHSWQSGYFYSIHTSENGKASDCVSCGACEAVCPQNLPIRELLSRVAAEFEKEE